MSQHPQWKAPTDDGQILIWPEPDRLLVETRENHRSLRDAEVLIQNTPLRELRAAQRKWIGHHDDQQPVLGCGHQTELYHPGVWVKDVLIDAAAKKLGAAGYHFGVDTDQPKHLHLRWPAVSDDGGFKIQDCPITDDPNLTTAEWTELLSSPTPAHLSQVERSLSRARFNFEPMLGEFLASLRTLALDPSPLPKSLTNATHQLSWNLGLRQHAVLCSPILQSEPYLCLAHHILARAAAFATQYNQSLGDYRRQNKIRTQTRPMPDLAVSKDSCEVPFWLDDLASARRARATVARVSDRFVLRVRGDEFAFDERADAHSAAGALGEFLRQQQVRLSPRALTLTLFLRLLVVDNFVHGIGGAQYDQITDRLIESHFKLEPPKFSVTTATMYFPDAAALSRVCLPCVTSEGHHLRHDLLGSRKRELVHAIEGAPRYSLQRRELFTRMHHELRDAAATDDRLRQWEQQVREAERNFAREAALFDRELFFAIQPRQRLLEMIERYRRAF